MKTVFYQIPFKYAQLFLLLFHYYFKTKTTLEKQTKTRKKNKQKQEEKNEQIREEKCSRDKYSTMAALNTGRRSETLIY